MPWLGFFKKISSCDLFVFLDDVQYEKNGWHNRNKIRTSDGSMWLTIPVKSHMGMLLNKVSIDNNFNWRLKHKKAIQINYSKAKNFKDFFISLDQIYEKNYDLLIDINMDIIKLIMNKFNIKTNTIFSSELGITVQGSDRILSICKQLGADVYLSGELGKNYLKLDDFERNGIKVQFQNFQHPIYSQCYESFFPNMSAIDLIFNEEKHFRQIFEKSKNF